MDWNQTCDRLRNRMFALARCPWEGKVECVQGPVLTAALEGDVLTIQAPDLSGAAQRHVFIRVCPAGSSAHPGPGAEASYRLLRYDGGYVPRRRDDGEGRQGTD